MDCRARTFQPEGTGVTVPPARSLLPRALARARQILGRLLGRRHLEIAAAPVLFLHLPEERHLARYFAAIPSETSIHERLFLYFLAKEMATGSNILELGPFLGGTTRALARGVQDSSSAARRVVTIDRFDGYYDVEAFDDLGMVLSAEERRDGSFRNLFERIHRSSTA